MKKQFKILLIIFSIFGLAFFGFSKTTEAQIDQGLIAYWDFDQIFGNLLKENISGYDGQNYKGTWEADGYKSGAMFFNSYSDNITNEGGVVTKKLPELSNFALLFWMKIEGPADVNLQNAVVSAPNFYVGVKNNIISFAVDGLANRIDVTITDNEWHHFAVIYNGVNGELYFYKDGNLNQYALARGDVIEAGSWRFGNGGHTAYPQKDVITTFKLDEVKLYNTILTEQQVSQEYNYNTSCTSDNWSCEDWGSCSSQSTQTRSCNKTFDCPGIDTPSPSISQTCTYIPTCISDDWSCANWGSCSQNGLQTRTCDKTSNCQGGVSAPTTSQSCTYVPLCTSYSWSCSDWGSCSSNNIKSRTCSKASNCEGGVASPIITQSCTYVPLCERDIWECDSWEVCSPNGIQTRSCNRTFDCSSVETATPATSKFCEVSNPVNIGVGENINRNQILKATVKLICPLLEKKDWASQGSGTIIDQYGTILTNRHVVLGTTGACKVGFISSEDDIPTYTEMADVKKISTDTSENGDMAILKIRNNGNKIFTAINVLKGNSDNLKSGDYILPFGYPNEDLFSQTITFTEGSYSGKGGVINVCGGKYNVSGYFKTDALIDHGNSGGGAYQKSSGYFMGIPTLGTSCNPDIPSRVNYILSVNTIKKWISLLGSNYDVVKNNFSTLKNYFSQSANVKDIDLATIKIADLSSDVSSTDKTNSTISTESTDNSTVSTGSLPDVSNLNELLSSLGKSRDVSEEEKYDKLLKSDAVVYKIEQSEEQENAVTNFVTYGMSSGTLQLGAGERRALVRDYFETVGRGDITWSDMENLVNGKKVVARNLTKENQQVTAVLKVFKKIFGHVPVFSDPKEDLSWNTMMYRIRFPRDLDKEKDGISQFKKIFNYLPKSPLDWATVRALGYID